VSAERLARSLLDRGGTVAELVDPSSAEVVRSSEAARPPGAARLPEAGAPAGPALLAASGPRASEHRDEYELLVETILEGSLLHYGPQRVVRTGDPDLALLVGDQLYALGLSRLAALGDLEAVSALADVIASVARSHAEGDPAGAAAAWDAGARRVGWGSAGE
jgi:hypothetical protein